MHPPSAPYKTWLLDLPFDVVTLQGAVGRVRSAALAGSRLMLATPNVNFAALASRDADFRRTVLDCDLFLADGMPIVWLSRLTATPLPERVSGSSLFMELAKQTVERPLRVFFFGGAEGVAEKAARNLPRLGGGLASAGWLSPGFGDLEQLSNDSTITAINDSRADFLLVAIGAKRGHEWMSRNRSRISVPVIAYLGATINFAAGTVRRAPGWVQRCGMEWLWRIAEEPGLAYRYARDGIGLLAKVSRFAWNSASDSNSAEASMLSISEAGKGKWEVSGRLSKQSLETWNTFLAKNADAALTLDLAGLTSADAAGLGALFTHLARYRNRRARLIATRPLCNEILAFSRTLAAASHPAIDIEALSA